MESSEGRSGIVIHSQEDLDEGEQEQDQEEEDDDEYDDY